MTLYRLFYTNLNAYNSILVISTLKQMSHRFEQLV